MRGFGGSVLRAALAGGLLASGVLGVDVLETVGFSSCNTNASVSVQKVDIRYNNDNKTVSFDVAGTSNQVQNVTAMLNVTAYGQNIYSNSFDPCDAGTFVQQLCPGLFPPPLVSYMWADPSSSCWHVLCKGNARNPRAVCKLGPGNRLPNPGYRSHGHATITV